MTASKIQPALSPSFHEQMCLIGNEHWSVARLAQLSADLPVFKLPIAHMNLSDYMGPYPLRELAGHMRAVMDADMTKPIILSEHGEIMDGRHRVLNAIVNGVDTVKAVRFETNPEPCQVDDD